MARGAGDCICSGLVRTQQTAEIVLGDRELELELAPELEEIRPLKGESDVDYDVYADVAYSHWRAQDYSATFLGGAIDLFPIDIGDCACHAVFLSELRSDCLARRYNPSASSPEFRGCLLSLPDRLPCRTW